MAEKGSGTRQALILAGIDEINAHGVAAFSVRRVAQACHVSCAAPYKHFRDKREFIAAIIDHVNELRGRSRCLRPAEKVCARRSWP